MATEELYKDLLFKYFSGEISETEKKDLLRWLKEKDEHKLLLDRMSDWWAIAHIPLFKSDLEADFAEHFDSLASALVIEKVTSKRFVVKTWMKIAAVSLFLIGIATSAFFVGRSVKPETALTYVETVVPKGSQTKIILPDSSVVMLNSGSSLRYRSDYNQAERWVELTGEAYFDVKSDAKKPFLVSSDKLNVQVEGTTFNVKAYDDERTIDVVLISGKVNVQFPDENREEVSLSPNQKMSYNKKEEKITVSVVNSANSILWTKGGLFFFEKPFPEIAKELERKYNVDIEIRSEALHREIFTGSFSSDYTLDRVVKEIDVDNKYRWTYLNRKLIITDK